MSLALYKKFGLPTKSFEAKHMVMWDVPNNITKAIPVMPRRLYINKVFITPLENALRSLVITGYASELKTWDGLYNNRPIRGYETKYKNAATNELKAKYLSVHSWGCAIDVNAATNGLGKKPTLSKGFVKCFKDNGFIWGGDFTRADGMHFQLDDKYI